MATMRLGRTFIDETATMKQQRTRQRQLHRRIERAADALLAAVAEAGWGSGEPLMDAEVALADAVKRAEQATS